MKQFSRSFACALFICVISHSLFAGGAKEEPVRVKETESWKESVDITEKPAGKYNFYIRANDLAGNEKLAGPYNMYIDPLSDLPQTMITNPRREMRVPGNLNIVGTCIDDDGVEYVEIVFDGDSANPVRAEGKEFWSYYLDTTKFTEGSHRIDVYGVDINGLKGKSDTVIWHLDRSKPVTGVENTALGALVSGTLTLAGSVTDGNGIDTLSYSLDRGESFIPVKLNKNKKTNETSFSVSIDTKKISDGPVVCWFKARDLQGSVGISTFLFFVDNTKPDVRILFPESGVSVNGLFTVAGFAGDTIELTSLSWKIGKESGAFDLTLGNPWWVKEFDIRGQKTKEVEIEISATDTSGNTTTVKKKFPVDQNADNPLVTVFEPKANSVIHGNSIPLGGIALDDDSVASVFYSLDGSSPAEIQTDGVFRTVLLDLAPGKHRLSVWAKDASGVEGPKVEIPGLTVSGTPPVISVTEVQIAGLLGKKGTGEKTPFVSGMELHSEHGVVIAGSVESGSALKELSWQFGDLAPVVTPLKAKEGVGGTTVLSIPLPAELPYGPVPFTVTAIDIHDRSTVFSNLIYSTDLTAVRGNPEVSIVDSRIGNEGTFTLDASHPLTGYFAGGVVAKASLVPASALARLETNGNLFSITPTGTSGSEDGVVVRVVTDRGYTYDSKPLNLRARGNIPQIKLSSTDLQDSASSVSISGTVSANLPLTALTWKLITSASGSAGAASGALTPKGADNAFELTLAADALPDGPAILEIAATTDGAPAYTSLVLHRPFPAAEPVVLANGKTAPVKIDPPAVTWIEAGALYYLVTFKGSLVSHSLTVDGTDASANTFPVGGAIEPSSLSAGSRAVSLKVTDDAAKSVSSAYKLTVQPRESAAWITTIDGTPFVNGTIVPYPLEGKKDSTLAVAVSSFHPVTSASVVYGAFAPVKGSVKKIAGDDWEILFSLPAGLPADRTKIAVSVEIKAPTAVSSLLASGECVIVREKDPSLVRNKEEFLWVNAEQLPDGRILLGKDSVLTGLYNGRPLASAKFARAQDGLSCEVEGGFVKVRALREGRFTPGPVSVTDIDGRVFTANEYSYLADFAPPEISFASPAEGLWTQNTVKLSVLEKEANAVASREYSLDGGLSWLTLSSLEQTLDLSQVADGFIPLAVRIRDEAGRGSEIYRAIRKDTLAPALSVIVPAPAEKVNGELRLGFTVIDAGRITAVEYRAEPEKASGSVTAPARSGTAAQGAQGTAATSRNAPAAPAQAAPAPAMPWLPLDPSRFVTTMIGTSVMPMTAGMEIRLTDAAGNSSIFKDWPFVIDQETDLPIVEIHLPGENDVVTTDFVISGVLYDDDRSSKIWYRIDNGNEAALEAVNGYSIPVALTSLTDNEHSVTIYAEDFYGVKGLPVTRNFRVSLEEPKAQVLKPEFHRTNKGLIEISGVSSDKNGIDRVQISVDNGNSYNDAVGTTEWRYTFDTKILHDGTHVVFVKVFDKYGIEGLYSSLINVDNTAPVISLELPVDGMRTVGPVFISGQTTDGIDLKNVTITIRSLDGHPVPAALAQTVIPAEAILAKAFDFSPMKDGLYNIDVSGFDAAGNITRVSRNVILDTSVTRNRIECLYPLNGQHLQGSFNVYGKVYATDPVSTVTLYVDGSALETKEVTGAGYYVFPITAENLSEGLHVLSVRSDFNGKEAVASGDLTLTYKKAGPWITIDNLVMGDFAFERPWLTGRSGYELTEEDKTLLADKKGDKVKKAEIGLKKIETVEISFDNGRTFLPVELLGKGEWKFRVETQDMSQGYHFLLVRSRMADGMTAVTRTIIQIDKTAPVIRLISPGEGGRYNQAIEFSGLASDDVELSFVEYSLRKGDKASYELPAFIQGLYFDAHFWGASLYDVGLGLSFFDDNVKLQVQYGQFTEEQYSIFKTDKMRFGGTIWGAKLLANLAYLPVSYFAGPDWSWLSASFALGANFSLFSVTQSGQAQMLSAVLAQIEFPRITIPKRSIFRTFSAYTEGQLWFIPTDVDTQEVAVQSFVPHITGGIRINVF